MFKRNATEEDIIAKFARFHAGDTVINRCERTDKKGILEKGTKMTIKKIECNFTVPEILYEELENLEMRDTIGVIEAFKYTCQAVDTEYNFILLDWEITSPTETSADKEIYDRHIAASKKTNKRDWFILMLYALFIGCTFFGFVSWIIKELSAFLVLLPFGIIGGFITFLLQCKIEDNEGVKLIKGRKTHE